MHSLAWVSLGASFFCALILIAKEIRHPEKMAVMNAVWPITALYWGVVALWFYLRNHAKPERKQDGPTWTQIALATSHCGAGCALADIVTEFTIFALGAKLFGSELWASYIWDLVAAWLLGIAFQYFSIKPMSDLSPIQALAAAIRADTFSILAFQVGMYGWMALVYFLIYPQPHLHPNSPVYWLMMQLGMICGFLTSMPMNWFLIRLGWKEAMD